MKHAGTSQAMFSSKAAEVLKPQQLSLRRRRSFVIAQRFALTARALRRLPPG
jgi:hypothetical protein